MMKTPIKPDTDFASPTDKLKWIMKCLRDPITGCPWDKEQNFKSIIPYTIEEAYEVADAIENGTMNDLKDELGDLLLQVIYHSQMAIEQNNFSFNDVANAVANKMISRHPHVFGDAEANNASDVNEIWDQQKDKEQINGGTLDNITKGLPALLRSQKIQKKAAKTGFEWPNSTQAFDKITEEIQEFTEATTDEHKEEEFGDLLFALTNYARMEGLNAEEALRKANNKFQKRFKGMEDDCRRKGNHFNDLTLDEMLKYWQRQK